ncbi:MAG: hypothetical protein KA170_17120 [Candidatus Promineofilum sp.]|nr:hypothetical protein [Promineifilum sp.]
MNEESRLFLADVQSKLNTYFSGEEIETLAFVLGIDYDALRGGTKPTKINSLLMDAARKAQLGPLLAWAREERTNVTWPDAPARLELPAGAAEEGGATVFQIGTLNTGGGGFFAAPVSAGGDLQAGRKDVGGDEIKGSKYVMSGDFRGAVLNIESRLDNVTQTLGALPNAAPDQRQELARLVGELKAALAQVPPEAVGDATNLTKRVEALAEEAAGDAPDPEYVRDLGESLKRAAGKLPGIATLVAAIVELVAAIVG